MAMQFFANDCGGLKWSSKGRIYGSVSLLQESLGILDIENNQ